jgi:hypothetical protein
MLFPSLPNFYSSILFIAPSKHLVHLLLIRIFASYSKNKSVKDSYHLLETDSLILVRYLASAGYAPLPAGAEYTIIYYSL